MLMLLLFLKQLTTEQGPCYTDLKLTIIRRQQKVEFHFVNYLAKRLVWPKKKTYRDICQKVARAFSCCFLAAESNAKLIHNGVEVCDETA